MGCRFFIVDKSIFRPQYIDIVDNVYILHLVLML